MFFFLKFRGDKEMQSFSERTEDSVLFCFFYVQIVHCVVLKEWNWMLSQFLWFKNMHILIKALL